MPHVARARHQIDTPRFSWHSGLLPAASLSWGLDLAGPQEPLKGRIGA